MASFKLKIRLDVEVWVPDGELKVPSCDNKVNLLVR
jgi:hypothetical protein